MYGHRFLYYFFRRCQTRRHTHTLHRAKVKRLSIERMNKLSARVVWCVSVCVCVTCAAIKLELGIMNRNMVSPAQFGWRYTANNFNRRLRRQLIPFRNRSLGCAARDQPNEWNHTIDKNNNFFSNCKLLYAFAFVCCPDCRHIVAYQVTYYTCWLLIHRFTVRAKRIVRPQWWQRRRGVALCVPLPPCCQSHLIILQNKQNEKKNRASDRNSLDDMRHRRHELYCILFMAWPQSVSTTMHVRSCALQNHI